MLKLFLQKLISLLPFWLQRVFGYIHQHRKQIIGFSVLVMIGTIFIPHVAYGEDFFDDIIRGLAHFVADIFLALAQFFITLAIFALKFFIQLAAYNGHTLADTVTLGWTMVRDVANMFFVVILLVIAFGTILGLEQFEWKKLTAKLVFAAIFINFSKLIAGLIIDAAHVFTLTFLNAIALTAGGNLINMFKMDHIFSLAYDANGSTQLGNNLEMLLVVAAFAAMMFAFLTMMAIAAYTVIMVVRTLILWMLIILSPIAYITSVLPQTQRFAQEYWKEFTSYIVAAPIMVFFLWLSFATLGAGDVNDDISRNAEQNIPGTGELFRSGELDNAQIKASIADITTWENMANFFLAFGFMMLGLEQVRKLNLRVGDAAVGAATGYTKKLAGYASGARAASFLVGQGVGLGKRAVGFGARKAGSSFLSVGTSVGRRLGGDYAVSRAKKLRNFMARKQVARDEYAARIAKMGLTGAKVDKDGNPVLDEKTGKQVQLGGLKRFALRRYASIVESSGRKNKKLEDWDDDYKAIKERHAESYSTSSSEGGIAKQKSRAELDLTMKQKAAKGAEKGIRAMENLLGETDKNGKLTKDAKRAQSMLGVTRNAKAFSQYKTEIQDEKEEILVSEAMDKQLGLKNVYSAAARAKWEKKRSERLGSADLDTSKIRIANLQKRLKGDLSQETLDAEQIRINALSGPVQANAQKKLDLKKTQREQLLRLSPALVDHAGTQGSAFDEAIMEVATGDKLTRATANITDRNLQIGQARQLSALLSKKVRPTRDAIKQAMDEYKERSGGKQEDLDAAMDRTIQSGFKVGVDGAEIRTALFRRDPKTGHVRPTTVAEDAGYIKGKRDYARSQVSPTKVEGIGGMVDRGINGELRASSKRARENMAVLFAKLDPQNVGSVQDQTIIDLNQVIENSSENSVELLVREMVETTAKPQAIKALLERTKIADKGIGEIKVERAKKDGTKETIVIVPSSPSSSPMKGRPMSGSAPIK